MAVILPMMAAMASSTTAAMAVTAAATAAAVASKVSEAHSQEAAADANAKMADQNQAIATEQGAAREAAQRRQGASYLGRQTAAAASSGLDITSGSSLDAARDSSTNLELDAQTIRYQGLMQGFGFQRQAGIDRAQSANIGAGLPLGVASTVLQGASQYYGMTRPQTLGSGVSSDPGFP